MTALRKIQTALQVKGKDVGCRNPDSTFDQIVWLEIVKKLHFTPAMKISVWPLRKIKTSELDHRTREPSVMFGRIYKKIV